MASPLSLPSPRTIKRLATPFKQLAVPSAYSYFFHLVGCADHIRTLGYCFFTACLVHDRDSCIASHYTGSGMVPVIPTTMRQQVFIFFAWGTVIRSLSSGLCTLSGLCRTSFAPERWVIITSNQQQSIARSPKTEATQQVNKQQ